jgi:hypothetical protein
MRFDKNEPKTTYQIRQAFKTFHILHFCHMGKLVWRFQSSWSILRAILVSV